jgi:hypothetical protein
MKTVAFVIISICIIPLLGFQNRDEEAAIKKVLETESATWRSGDIKAHAACWHIQPYSKILVSTTEGKCFDVAPESMIHPPSGKLGDGGSSYNLNYQFSIHDQSAWVSHDEVSLSRDNHKTYSHEIRLLEKINGEWKLVGQSIHLYQP